MNRVTAFALLTAALFFHPAARAAEHITLKNGFDLICDHRAADGERMRLYLDASDANFVDVGADEIVAVEHVDLPRETNIAGPSHGASSDEAKLTPQAMHEMLAQAGEAHDLDVDLLASVIKAESGGNPHAVSRTGAQGLMQLMPKTAAGLGVGNSFAPGENISGGTTYLDALLKKYHDNLALALAAYNAGPAAVDRWHGVPPYRETRAYVARVIREFNRRYAARVAAQRQVASVAGGR
ncbi:lytic transglycosylase domain-containing protein [Acidobacterium sp. S8]|uniref:lytic transglycosylase domain-containing protein n=1 Tax=Acidobacterium sp. S8 TaxID=1641854 RepID=UPI00131BD260|nr:lytic transglycosylase domain-containing protein [Acidobacterium sp. S8]